MLCRRVALGADRRWLGARRRYTVPAGARGRGDRTTGSRPAGRGDKGFVVLADPNNDYCVTDKSRPAWSVGIGGLDGVATSLPPPRQGGCAYGVLRGQVSLGGLEGVLLADAGRAVEGGQGGQLGAAGGEGVVEGRPVVDAPVRVVGLTVVVVVDVGAPAAGEGAVDVQSELHGRNGFSGDWAGEPDQNGSGRPDGVRRSMVFVVRRVRSGLRRSWICRFIVPVLSVRDCLVG